MGHLFWLTFFFLAGIISLFYPWIGVVISYFITLLRPYKIWWWHFQGIRPFFTLAVPTLIGFVFYLFRGKVSFLPLKNRFVGAFFIWFFFVTLSYLFGPYVNIDSEYRFWDPAQIFDIEWKIFFYFFLACLLIDSREKLKYFTLPIILSSVYLIYWANSQYLWGHYYGRLRGPMGTDENFFAMMFVIGLPFFYYLGWYIHNKFFRYLLWILIPFGWHAVFLTGSRGGLLGLVVTILFVAFRSPKKIFGFLLIPIFILAYQWQAGSVMKERAHTISEYEQESSAQTRLEAWQAAIKMIKKHPFLGVGLASFGPAFPDFSDKKPRAAHNTFFQIAAESGIVAGISYLFIILSAFLLLFRASKFYKDKDPLLYFVSEATLTSLLGFFVCSMFLSLHLFEGFFYLCVIVNFFAYYNKIAQVHS